ncbi:MAG: aldo/keto reductase [Faecalibacillus intestinalis]
MEERILGNNFKVSAVGLGCMGFSHGYGVPTEKSEAIEKIREAFNIGYTLFDTAEVYGTQDNPHDNEILVGEALHGIRNEVQIISKFGVQFDMTSNAVNKPIIANSKPETIIKSVEGSLKRLKTDRIDLYLQHRIDPDTEPEEVAQVMAQLIKEGKILNWGISETNEEYLRRAHNVCPVTAVENRYSMMARQYESLFPVLEELNVGFIAFSPMANGILTGKYNNNSNFDKKTDYRSNMPQFQKEAYDKNQQLIKLLEETASKYDATPAQISMAWMLCKKPWIVPIPGTRKVERMKENAKAAQIKLSMDEVNKLDDMLNNMTMSEVFGGSKIVK